MTETKMWVMYMANGFNEEECINIFGENMGKHFWNKWVAANERHNADYATMRLAYEMSDRYFEQLVRRAVDWHGFKAYDEFKEIFDEAVEYVTNLVDSTPGRRLRIPEDLREGMMFNSDMNGRVVYTPYCIDFNEGGLPIVCSDICDKKDVFDDDEICAWMGFNEVDHIDFCDFADSLAMHFHKAQTTFGMRIRKIYEEAEKFILGINIHEPIQTEFLHKHANWMDEDGYFACECITSVCGNCVEFETKTIFFNDGEEDIRNGITPDDVVYIADVARLAMRMDA